MTDSYLYVHLTDAEVLDMAKAHLRSANAAPKASTEAARETRAFHGVMAVLSRRQLMRLAAEIRAGMAVAPAGREGNGTRERGR